MAVQPWRARWSAFLTLGAAGSSLATAEQAYISTYSVVIAMSSCPQATAVGDAEGSTQAAKFERYI